jgi:hypothetical protein
VSRGALAVGAALLLAALVLRGVCPGAHLPFVLPPEDVAATLGGSRLGLDRFGLAPLAGGLLSMLLALLDGVLFAVARLLGTADRSAFELARAADPSTFWRGARLVVALLGTATVAWLGVEARRRLGLRGAALAMGLLALSAAHVEASRLVASPVATALVAFGALVMAGRATGLRSTILSVALVGLALRGGWPAMLLLLPGLWISAPGGEIAPTTNEGEATARGDGVARRRRILLLGAAIAFVVDPLAMARAATWSDFALPGVATMKAWLDALLSGLGPAGLAVAALGVALAIVRRRPDLQAHAFGALLVVGVALARDDAPRFLLVALPSLVLLAAFALEDLGARLRGPAGSVLMAAAAVALVAEPAVESVRTVILDCGRDTRVEAALWIRNQVEHRTAILVEEDPQVPFRPIVPVDDLKRTLRERADRLGEKYPYRADYWRLRAETLEPPLPELTVVGESEVWPTLEEARSRGLAFVVVVPERMGLVAGGDDPVRQSRRRFYEALLNEPSATLQQSFEPERLGRGPRLEMWAITAR